MDIFSPCGGTQMVGTNSIIKSTKRGEKDKKKREIAGFLAWYIISLNKNNR